MPGFTHKLIGCGTFLCTFAALGAEPVYLKPGQCLLIGSQQVCALKEDQTDLPSPAKEPSPVKVSQCRWGAYDESDKKAQGWAHFLMTIKDDGTKQETMIRYYGPADKEGCENDAKEFNSKLKPHGHR